MNKTILLALLILVFTACKNNKKEQNNDINDIKIENTDTLQNNQTTINNPENNDLQDSLDQNLQTSQKNCPIFEDYDIPSPITFKYAVNQTKPDFNLLFDIYQKDFDTH